MSPIHQILIEHLWSVWEIGAAMKESGKVLDLMECRLFWGKTGNIQERKSQRATLAVMEEGLIENLGWLLDSYWPGGLL